MAWEWTHRTESVNGIEIHLVEQGEETPVILLHGVPHLWFSWRHQIPAIASAGWRAVAPDLRGMGQTSCPEEVAEYDLDHGVADAIGLLDALGEPRAVFVGLDVGANIAWNVALRAPERVLGVVGLNNPLLPWSPVRPSDVWAEAAKDHFVHSQYFQEPGVADKELYGSLREYLQRVYWSLSGAFHYLDVWNAPPDAGYLDALPEAPPLPWSWMSEAEMEFYVSEYHRTGVTGMLNYYRNFDRNWEQTRPYADDRIEAPAAFIAAERDCDLEGFHGESPLDRMRQRYADLRDVAVVEGAGHMVQMERPDDVNAIIVRFLRSLESHTQV